MVAARSDTVFRNWAWRRFCVFQRQRRFNLLLQHAQHALIDKIMHQSRLVEPYFMLGRMDVHIHLMRVDVQIKHESRLLIGPELVFAGGEWRD